MKVKVIREGFYNLERRSPGTILDIKPEEFSDKWMTKSLSQRVDSDDFEPSPRKGKKASEAKANEETDPDLDVI